MQPIKITSYIVVLIHVDMTEEMQQEVVQYVITAMDTNESDLPDYVCSRMKSNHSGDWHCFSHQHTFGYSVVYNKRYYFYFQLKSTYMLVFRK